MNIMGWSQIHTPCENLIPYTVPHEPTLHFITEYDSSGLIRITSQIYLQVHILKQC